MNDARLKQYAKFVIKEALGLDVLRKNIVLLEATADGNEVSYLLFRINGIKEIEYCVRKTYPSRLDAVSIVNKINNQELFISYQL